MTNDKTLLLQQINEQKAILANSNNLGAQKKAINKIQKLERRLTCIEAGGDPSNNGGRIGALAIGAALAPFTGGTSLVMAGLHVGFAMAHEQIRGTDTYVTTPDSPEAAKQAEIEELEAKLAALKNS